MGAGRALGALLLTVALAGCAKAGDDVGELTVTRTTWGGMCPDGPCRSELVVEADGSWRYEGDDTTSTGRLSAAELDRLREAVASTGLGGAGAPSTHCAVDSDGTSVGYAWTLDGRAVEVDSCTVTIDTGDPLVRQMTALAERVSG